MSVKLSIHMARESFRSGEMVDENDCDQVTLEELDLPTLRRMYTKTHEAIGHFKAALSSPEMTSRASQGVKESISMSRHAARKIDAEIARREQKQWLDEMLAEEAEAKEANEGILAALTAGIQRGYKEARHA